MEPKRSLSQRLKFISAKITLENRSLKNVFFAGLLIFGFSLFVFKFEIISTLNLNETARLNSVSSLKNLVSSASDPLQGILQWISLKALPNHQIFALRLPSALMLLAIIGMLASSLYIKYRNRYLPYVFITLSLTSPWLILLAHQGSLRGIDLLFFISALFTAYLAITATELRENRKKLALLVGAFSLGSITLQPVGIPFAIFFGVLLYKSEKLKLYLKSLDKKSLILSGFLLVLALSLNVLFALKNSEFLLNSSSFNALKDPLTIIKSYVRSLAAIFNIARTDTLSSGTGRPDFLLIGAVALAVYEIIRKRPGRLILLLCLTGAIKTAGIYGDPSSIVLAVPFALAIISLALANMIRIVDLAFPRNPYPRNLARTGMLLLICMLAGLNIYTFSSATIRQNTPTKINNIIVQDNKKLVK